VGDERINKTGDKRMTVREVAEVLNVSERVVQLAVKKLYPEIVRNGLPTYLNETQVTAIKLELESYHNLEGIFEVSTRLERQLYIAKALQFANEEIHQLQSELSHVTGGK
jgi:transcriptional antiterminator